MLEAANQTRLPRLRFLNPGWVLFNRGHVKAARAVMPRRAVGLPGSRSPASACWVAAQPRGGGCARGPVSTLSGMSGRERGWQVLLEWGSDWDCFWKGKAYDSSEVAQNATLNLWDAGNPSPNPGGDSWGPEGAFGGGDILVPCCVWGTCPMHPQESPLPCTVMWHQHSSVAVSFVSPKTTMTCLRDTVGTFLPTHPSVREKEKA